MNGRWLQGGLAAVAALGLGASGRFAFWPLVTPELMEAVAAVEPTPVRRMAVPEESLGAAVVSRNPFRVGRRPAATPYDPLTVGQPQSPLPPKPALVLVGLLWDGGGEPTALVEGLPGVEGARALRAGEMLAGVRCHAISTDQVRLVGFDTTWVLRVREPWN